MDIECRLPGLDEKRLWAAFDDFVLEAMVVAVEWSRDWLPVTDEEISAARVSYGLKRYSLLWDVGNWIAEGGGGTEAWYDAPLWLWGPRARSGSQLYEAVGRMSRGPIVAELTSAGWKKDWLAELFKEWLRAARVHKNCEGPAIDMFLHPRATQQQVGEVTPSYPVRKLALQICQENAITDPKMIADAARLLAWIGAKLGRAERVRLSARQVTQGRRVKGSAGIVAHRARPLWALLQQSVLRKCRNHCAGRFNAEYEIKPEIRAVLVS